MFGVLPINKPPVRTSRDVCNRVERVVRPDKVGHTGTLDPMATGVLLLAIGSAARLVEFSLGHTKEYEADFLLGQHSETLDTEATTQALDDPPIPTLEQLQQAAEGWVGKVRQVPPKFSAINVAGKRAYQLARKGRDFELAAREIHILGIEILAYRYPLLTLHIGCGSGTYIRSLGSDIARQLGSDAVMSRLVRTRVGPFTLADCAELEQLTTVEQIADHLRPPQLLIADLQTILLDNEQVSAIRNGIPLWLPGTLPDRLVATDQADQLIAVLTRCTRANSAAELPDETSRPSDQTLPSENNLLPEKAAIPRDHRRYRSLRVFQASSDTSQLSPINKKHNPES